MQKIKSLRMVGMAEGISFLVLLLIAMPLKYMLGIPEAVKVVGWAHGILFMIYIVAVVMAIKAMQWNWFSVLLALAASVVPAGPFFLDRQLRRREQELNSGKTNDLHIK